MYKLIQKIIFTFIIFGIFLFPVYALAFDLTSAPAVPGETEQKKMTTILEGVATVGGFKTGDTVTPAAIVGTIITAALSLIGVIFIMLMVYGGYLWMTASGNDEQATKAKSILTKAIIGLVIVVSAYAITWFVNTYIIQAGYID